MAKKTVVEVVDDIDGTPIPSGEGGRVTFGLEGKSYEIDLTTANLEHLREVLAPYIAGGRRVGGRARSGPAGRAVIRASEVRAWAKQNGHQVPDRGRIPAAVTAAFDAAH